MYLLVIIKEVNVEEMLAALLPAGGLTTGYSYHLVTINSLAFASQLITVRSLYRCSSLFISLINLSTVKSSLRTTLYRFLEGPILRLRRQLVLRA